MTTKNYRNVFIFTLILVLGLMLVACELPSPSGGEVQTVPDGQSGEVVEEGEQPETEDADPAEDETAGGDDVDAESGADAAADESESPREEDVVEGEPTTVPTEEGGAEATAVPSEEGEAEATPVPGEEGEAVATPVPAEEGDEVAEETGEEPISDGQLAEIPENGIHVVQPGENLYRIGLKYGYSWVVLAQYNGLFNANSITVGQEIRIPPRPDAQPDSGPTPTPTATGETQYIVAAGDNLFLIGLQYGIDWIQIAEANGLVNPNYIVVGQTLKIPSNQPGDSPEFTHVVQPGETLFLIALRYGVSWPAIAEANELEAPYVIYPQQTLVIPASE